MSRSEDSEQLATKIYSGKLDMIGKTLNSSCIITGILVDGRKTGDTIIYTGILYGKDVIIKYVLDNDLNDPLQKSVKIMDHIKSLKVPLYFYQLDKYISNCINDDTNNFLIIEKLYKVQKNDVFNMLIQLLVTIFKYKDYMTHCDIKPDNIMCSAPDKDGNKIFYFIDYDDICNQRLLYGYARKTFTPQFTSQTHNVWPVLTTIKHDIIELILSAHAIYYENDESEDPKYANSNPPDSRHWLLVWDINSYNQRRIFGPLYVTALTINEKNPNSKDLILLLRVLTLIIDKNHQKLNQLLYKIKNQ